MGVCHIVAASWRAGNTAAGPVSLRQSGNVKACAKMSKKFTLLLGLQVLAFVMPVERLAY